MCIRDSTKATGMLFTADKDRGGVVLKDFVKWSSDAPPAAESDSMTGHDAAFKFDQFKINEQRFGINSTFEEERYTTRLDPEKITPTMKQLAEKIERELENEKSDFRHIAEERGQVAMNDYDEDEEALYSAVLDEDKDVASQFKSKKKERLKKKGNKDKDAANNNNKEGSEANSNKGDIANNYNAGPNSSTNAADESKSKITFATQPLKFVNKKKSSNTEDGAHSKHDTVSEPSLRESAVKDSSVQSSNSTTAVSNLSLTQDQTPSIISEADNRGAIVNTIASSNIAAATASQDGNAKKDAESLLSGCDYANTRKELQPNAKSPKNRRSSQLVGALNLDVPKAKVPEEYVEEFTDFKQKFHDEQTKKTLDEFRQKKTKGSDSVSPVNRGEESFAAATVNYDNQSDQSGQNLGPGGASSGGSASIPPKLGLKTTSEAFISKQNETAPAKTGVDAATSTSTTPTPTIATVNQTPVAALKAKSASLNLNQPPINPPANLSSSTTVAPTPPLSRASTSETVDRKEVNPFYNNSKFKFKIPEKRSEFQKSRQPFFNFCIKQWETVATTSKITTSSTPYVSTSSSSTQPSASTTAPLTPSGSSVPYNNQSTYNKNYGGNRNSTYQPYGGPSYQSTYPAYSMAPGYGGMPAYAMPMNMMSPYPYGGYYDPVMTNPSMVIPPPPMPQHNTYGGYNPGKGMYQGGMGGPQDDRRNVPKKN
eukprot:TRINITY_DN9063_c0_g1_i2.p1 TRINITY_DN9063_c0_g1~~TRINITY_DN9063_c0_g1_i2.p1  ORF type:complete len:738 (-),score=174.89 TRINITY_DN9063_c0_g1_i2:369-2501(-)